MLINDREYQSSLTLKTDSSASSPKNYLFTLNYLSVLQVSGQDPLQYLQGQLTSDIKKVTNNFSQPGAICNIKGRILALLNVILWEQYYLILPTDLQNKIKKTLTKTAMFSKINIDPVSEFVFFGIYTEVTTSQIKNVIHLPKNVNEVSNNDKLCCIKIADRLYIMIVRQKYINAVVNEFPEKSDSLNWHTLCIQAGLLEIYPNTSGEFLPHRLNLHKSSYISFEKGCFVGQEIIARTHYRAKLKHGVFKYQIITPTKIFAGQKIYSITNMQEIGELIDYAILEDNKLLILISILIEHDNKVKFANSDDIILLTCDKT